MSARRLLGALAALALAALALAACEHPIAIVTPHVEAADVLVRDADGATLARTHDNRRWEGGPLVARDGAATAVVVELLDFQGRALSDAASRADVELRLEAEDDGRVAWEPLRGRGLLHGLAAGRTRVRFLVWHQTHADLVTPWIPLEVRPASPPTSTGSPR
ncbi:hypothetical protein [Roseisolibacter sp. H3M3-2]|uniref:hypothetical protein n=1 Tax=Roseisolibacter sp. H3M3-2 TaxID=3031323 RepID=UPI0023DA2AF5|nr:hypothetical protein [Roseisolibacter sp. H3M3-2]MDF1505958.1 hypothetical protein [Roseisolibacter sp. H3M3-2]